MITYLRVSNVVTKDMYKGRVRYAGPGASIPGARSSLPTPSCVRSRPVNAVTIIEGSRLARSTRRLEPEGRRDARGEEGAKTYVVCLLHGSRGGQVGRRAYSSYVPACCVVDSTMAGIWLQFGATSMYQTERWAAAVCLHGNDQNAGWTFVICDVWGWFVAACLHHSFFFLIFQSVFFWSCSSPVYPTVLV